MPGAPQLRDIKDTHVNFPGLQNPRDSIAGQSPPDTEESGAADQSGINLREFRQMKPIIQLRGRLCQHPAVGRRTQDDRGAQNNEQTGVPGASHIPGGLQYSGLGIEALQFGIDKLQALQLRFGFV